MKVMELLTAAVEQEAADIFLIPGRPFSYKIGGRIICEGPEKIMPDEMDDIAFPRQYFPSERFSGRRYPCCAI